MTRIIIFLTCFLCCFNINGQQNDNFQFAYESISCLETSGKINIAASESGISSFPLPWYVEVENLQSNDFIDFDMTSRDLIIDGLESGTYLVNVWLDYENGCFQSFELEINIDHQLQLIETIKTNSNCVLKDYPNGEIELSVLNGEPPYSFVWSDNKTGSRRWGLMVGNYSVTVTDQNGCSAEKKYYVPQSPAADQDIILSGTVTNASCGRRNGAIDLSIMSLVDIWVDVEWYMINPLLLFTDPIIGIKKERLFINNSFNMEDISNLPPGKYFVIVRALNGCSYMKDFTIENDDLLLDIQTIYDCSNESNSKIIINVLSGHQGLTYRWNWKDQNGVYTTYNTTVPELPRTNDQTGSYTVTIADNTGCTKTLNTTFGPLEVNVPSEVVICPQKSVIISPSVKNGSPPYDFLWSDGSSFDILENITQEGTYNVTVTDQSNCSVVKSIQCSYFTELTFDFRPFHEDIINGYCHQPEFCDCSGRLEVSGTAIPNQPYSWMNDQQKKDFYSSFLKWEKDGIKELFNQSSEGYAITNLCAGKYTVSTTQTICPITREIDLDYSPCKTKIILEEIQHACICTDGNCFGKLSVSLSSGREDEFEFKWYKNGVLYSNQQNLTNLCPGTYTIECINNESTPVVLTSVFEIKEDCNGIASSKVDIIEIQQATNCETNDGFIRIKVNYDIPVSYTWSTGGIGDKIENLHEGTYYVTITSSCFQIVKAYDICSCGYCIYGSGWEQEIVPGSCEEIERNFLSSLTIEEKQASTINSNDGALLVKNVISSHSMVQFQWTGPNNFISNQHSIHNLYPGKYILSLNMGCGPYTYTYYVTSKESCEDLELTLSLENCSNKKKSPIANIQINVVGGSGSYTYSMIDPKNKVNNGGMGSEKSISVSNEGVYKITVFDLETGCIKHNNIRVNKKNIEYLRVHPHNAYTYRLCDDWVGENTTAFVKLLVKGGNSPYTVRWHDGITETIWSNATGQRKFNVLRNESFVWRVTITDACGEKDYEQGRFSCNQGLDENGNPIPCDFKDVSVEKDGSTWFNNGNPDWCFDKCDKWIETYCSKIAAYKNTSNNKSYSVRWPNGFVDYLSSEYSSIYEVENIGIVPVVLKNEEGCSEVRLIDYSTKCKEKHIFDYLGEGNTDNPGCPKIIKVKNEGENGINYNLNVEIENTNNSELNTVFEVFTRDNRKGNKKIYSSSVPLSPGENNIEIPVTILRADPDIDEFIVNFKFIDLGFCNNVKEFTFKTEGIEACPSMNVVYTETGRIEIYSPVDIENCLLKIQSLPDQLITLNKNEVFTHDFSLNIEGYITVVLDFPSTHSCTKLIENFYINNSCNQNALSVNIFRVVNTLSVNAFSSSNMLFNAIIEKQNGSRINLPNTQNLNINGSANFEFDVSGLSPGLYKIKFDYTEPKCPAKTAQFEKVQECPYTIFYADYNSSLSKLFIRYTNKTNKVVMGKYFVSLLGDSKIILEKEFLLNSNVSEDVFTIDLSSLKLKSGRYQVFWSPFTEYGCTPQNIAFNISDINSNDPPAEFNSCDDTIFEMVFDSTENKYIAFWSSPEKDSILVGYSFDEDITKMDFYSILDKPQGDLTAVRNDSIKNHYFTVVSDSISSFSISKVGILNDLIWDTTFTNKKFISQSKYQSEFNKIIVEDETSQQLQILTVNDQGEVINDSLTIPQLPYYMIKYLAKGIVTARYTSNNLSIMFHRFDGVRKEVLLDKNIRPVDIQSINESEITLGAEFRGDVWLDTVEYSSGPYKNMLFLKFNNELQIVKVLHEFDQKNQRITSFANDGSNTIAIAGVHSSEANSFDNDTCIFIKVLYWDNPDTCAQEFEIISNPVNIDSVFSINVQSPFSQTCTLTIADSSQILYTKLIYLQKGINNVNIAKANEFTDLPGKYAVQLDFEMCPILIDTLILSKGFQFDCINEILDLNYDSLSNQFTYFTGLHQADSIHGFSLSFDTLSGFFNEFTRHEIEWDWVRHVRYDSTKAVYYFGTDSIFRSFVTWIDTNGVSNTTWFQDIIFVSCGPLNQQGIWTLVGYKVSEQKYYMYQFDKVNLTPLPLNIPNDNRGQTYTTVWNFGPDEYTTKIVSGPYEILKFSSSAYPPFEVSLPRPFKIKTVTKWASNQWLVTGDLKGTLVIAGDTLVSEEWIKSVFIWYDWTGTVIKYKIIESEEERIITHVATDGYRRIFFTGMEIDTIFHENPDSITIETCIFGDTLTVEATIQSFRPAADQNTSLAVVGEVDDFLRFYPNPFNQGIHVVLDAKKEDNVVLTAFGMTGHQVFTRDWQVLPGRNELYLREFETLPAGLYSVLVKTSSSEHAVRVVKVE